MALTNYSELKAAVAEWLNRENSSITARIPDFILFGEKSTFRQLRCRHNEAVETYASGNIDGITLPAGYKESKLLTWDGKPLTRRSSEWYWGQNPSQSTQGTPYAFARIEKDQVAFFPPPDNDAEVKLYYYEQQGPISDSVTPDLFVEAPELYLFGALIEAFPYLQNTDPGVFAIWQGKYENVLLEVQGESENEEASGSTSSVASPYPDDEGIY